jgi:hypothetical protein
MDLDGVERIDFNALSGADNIVVNDLSGADLVEINLALASTLGGTMGDAQPDNVTDVGTNGDDAALVAVVAAGSVVLGLAARVNITGAEAANDRVTAAA